MSTKVTTAFLERIRKSGLVSSERLSQLRQELETEGVDVDAPTALSNALVARGELSQWQADKLLQGKHKGFFLGSYRLEKPLGKGGMGAVFLARHVVMRRQCAIKVLPQTQIQKHSSVLDRFILESQAVAALDHQNIVRAYDISSEVKDNKEIHYLVMEYVEGQDAQQTVQEHGVLSYVKAAEIIRQTANGLAHAHENGLVHRDIKPANLLMDKKGIVKVLDLGLARFFDDDEAASLTAAHNETVLGTADYLSPEQALNSHDVDLRTDIYSLGCTAYFLLTGHPPFPTGTVAQRLVSHQVKQPEPITNERPDAPRELVAIIDKMMAKRANDRFKDCTEISTAIAAWLIKFGGEDWRRQHSDITADSNVLKLLTTHREPTRAMASPMSETELELAPLDDDEHETQAASAPTAGSGSDVAGRSAGSSNRLKDDLGMAGDHDDPSTAEATAQQLPALDEQEDAHSIEVIDELPTLDQHSASDSSHDGLFGALPLEGGLDSLGDLDQAASLGAIDSSPGSGALDSDIRKMPVGSSPSASTRRKKVEPDKPKTLWQAITSVGLPIVVGVVGGGVLVLIVLLVYLFTGPASPDRTDRSTMVVGAGAGSSTDEVAGQPKQQPEQDTAPAHDEQPQPNTAPEKDRPSDQPGGSGGMSVQADSTTRQKRSKKHPEVDGYPERQDEQPAQQPVAPVQPEVSVTQQPVVDYHPVLDGAVGSSDQPEISVSEPQVDSDRPGVTLGVDSAMDNQVGSASEPVRLVQPQAAPVTRNQVFATVTEFSLNVTTEAAGGGGPNKKPGQNTDVLTRTLRPGIEKALNYATKNTDLKLVSDCTSAVMNVTITVHSEDEYTCIDMATSLDCRYRGSDPASVWDIEKTEVMKFKPATTKERLLMSMWDDNSRDFFQPLRNAHEAAMQDAGQ